MANELKETGRENIYDGEVWNLDFQEKDSNMRALVGALIVIVDGVRKVRRANERQCSSHIMARKRSFSQAHDHITFLFFVSIHHPFKNRKDYDQQTVPIALHRMRISTIYQGLLLLRIVCVDAFSSNQRKHLGSRSSDLNHVYPLKQKFLVSRSFTELSNSRRAQTSSSVQRFSTRLFMFQDPRTDEEIEEEVRKKVLSSRRKMIRSTLKSAESLRNFRLKNNFVPQVDENGKVLKSDGKVAVSLTAFVVAAGAIALRVGGRAALVSTLGLDFVTENPELKENLDQILNTSDNMDPATKLFLFTAAWTVVKVFCFDAGGVALALASGILFDGVLNGALLSAAAATVGSSVAFGMAKLDTPVRKKALEVLEEYPSLRGIEKVVATDGLKAILTLRLAPVLPIPLGLYNYIYGVTKVPYRDFAGGIFLGSLKPYLLDSYLGYFGKTVVDGSIAEQTGFQDILLLVILGFSVLIGVFASQLASETWESVLEEVETNQNIEHEEESKEDFLGLKKPKWVVDFQNTYDEADERVQKLVESETIAQVWNMTGVIPPGIDPAMTPDSFEVAEEGQGIKYGRDITESFALTPVLFSTFLKYADPLFQNSNNTESPQLSTVRFEPEKAQNGKENLESSSREEVLLRDQLSDLKSIAQSRIEEIDGRLKDTDSI